MTTTFRYASKFEGIHEQLSDINTGKMNLSKRYLHILLFLGNGLLIIRPTINEQDGGQLNLLSLSWIAANQTWQTAVVTAKLRLAEIRGILWLHNMSLRHCGKQTPGRSDGP